jgi:hypothetical protein
MDRVRKLVEGKLNSYQIVFINGNPKSKKISIGFPSAEVREKAKDLLIASKILEPDGYTAKDATKMLPKVTIYGVPTDIMDCVNYDSTNNEAETRDEEKKVIVNRIVEKNPAIDQLCRDGHTLSVIFVQPSTRTRNQSEQKELTIGLKVSPSIYNTIFEQQNGSLYLGSRRHSVHDRFHVKTCYHCQMIGHMSADCKEAKAGNPQFVCFVHVITEQVLVLTNREEIVTIVLGAWPQNIPMMLRIRRVIMLDPLNAQCWYVKISVLLNIQNTSQKT